METNSKTSTNAREFKRLRAIELYKDGMKQTKIAEVLGVTRGAVSQWIKIYHGKGVEGLKHKKSPGRPCRLSLEQQEELLCFLKQGPEAFGYTGYVWTQSRVRDLIQRKFDIIFYVTHIRKILKKLRWSCQKPCSRATQRNENEIAKWLEERWPEIKKSP